MDPLPSFLSPILVTCISVYMSAGVSSSIVSLFIGVISHSHTYICPVQSHHQKRTHTRLHLPIVIGLTFTQMQVWEGQTYRGNGPTQDIKIYYTLDKPNE